MIILFDSIGQPIDNIFAAMKYWQLADSACWRCGWVSGLLENQAWPSSTSSSLHRDHHSHQLIPVFLLWFCSWLLVVKLLQQIPWCHYLYEKNLPIDGIRLCKCHRSFLAVMIAIVSFAQFSPRKRRRILKEKGTVMQPTQKKPLTAFTVISALSCSYWPYCFCIFPFLLRSWPRGLWKSGLIPTVPTMVPKMPAMSFQQLMVQPAMQWMWSSVFISLTACSWSAQPLLAGDYMSWLKHFW